MQCKIRMVLPVIRMALAVRICLDGCVFIIAVLVVCNNGLLSEPIT